MPAGDDRARSPRPWRPPGRRSPPTSGAPRRPATWAAGRSRAPVLPQRAHRRVGTAGRHAPQRLEQVHRPRPRRASRPTTHWNELLWPREYPLAHHEMSFLLPHFLKEGRGRLDVYFTRVYNPVWTNPDGFSWMRGADRRRQGRLPRRADADVVGDRDWFADYVLPMGHATERHDTHSYETHAGRWLGFRQPVLRVAMEKLGTAVRRHAVRGQPGRGVGGERVLDRAVVAHRPRRLARHPHVLRVAVPAGREGHASTSTTAGCSRTGCPACRRRPPQRGPRPARLHAQVRRRRDRAATSTGRTSAR